MQIAAVLFPRVTALDIVGPYEVLQRLPDTTVVFVGHDLGTVRTENGAIPTQQRVVEHLDRRIITGAGVSAGIDMALRLSELLVDDVAAKAMQLMIEYDPQPPYDCGALAKASKDVIERVIEYAHTAS